MSALDDFTSHIQMLQRQRGVDLSPDDIRRLYGLSVADGFTFEATEKAFAEVAGSLDPVEPGDLDWDDDMDDDDGDDELDAGAQAFVTDVGTDIERLEREWGRPATLKEKAAILEGALDQVERYGSFDVQRALQDNYEGVRPNLDSNSGRQEFFRQRLEEKAVQPESDGYREFDLDKDRDRRDFLTARMNGQEFEDAADE